MTKGIDNDIIQESNEQTQSKQRMHSYYELAYVHNLKIGRGAFFISKLFDMFRHSGRKLKGKDAEGLINLQLWDLGI